MIRVACPEDHDLLPFVSGETEAVTTEVREHIDGCSECRLRLERMRAEVSSLRRNVRAGMTLSDFDPGPADRAETVDLDPLEFDFSDRDANPAPAAGPPVAIGKYLVVVGFAGSDLAEWALRVEAFRVFYVVIGEEELVKVVAIGWKEGNALFIHGEKFEL